MNSQHVTVRDLSAMLGMDRSHTLRLIKKLNVETFKHRDAESGNQATVAVSRETANEIMKWRSDRGFGSSKVTSSAAEFLYVVEIDPDARPGRVKVGMTTNEHGRFSEYRTICPSLSVLRLWPVPTACEGYLIALAGAFGARVGQELFDIGDQIGDFLDAADSAFSHLVAE